MRVILRKILIGVSLIISGFFILLLIYFLAAIVGMFIPVNTDFRSPKDGIEIFVKTNGRHADLIVPVNTDIINLRDFFPQKAWRFIDKAEYISLGWGDKHYYLNVRSFSDLNFKAVVNALFLPSEPAFHVKYFFKRPALGDNISRIVLNKEDYENLVDYILESFKQDREGKFILYPASGYDEYDQFFAANGKYSFIWTSNNWTNQGLKEAGVKNSLWTPFDWGVFFYLE